MQNPLLLTAVIGSVVILWLSRWLFSHVRLRLALSRPFPENWVDIIKRRLPVYEHMPVELQEQLHEHVRIFLWHKEFIGCAGLEVTEEMRVTIAACACLLLLNRPTLKFRNVRWIYLYPGEFIARHTIQDVAGVATETSSLLSGEAWSNGRVILSWDDVAHGVRDFNDGRNVVLHEFAHQLDGESGDTNGAPLLYSKGAYGTWAMVMSREFKALRDHTYFGSKTVLDTYGATSPAEFFAVATESFFEEPDALAAEYPDLYEELKNYFQVDPRQWKPASRSPKGTKGNAGEEVKPEMKPEAGPRTGKAAEDVKPTEVSSASAAADQHAGDNSLLAAVNEPGAGTAPVPKPKPKPTRATPKTSRTPPSKS